MFSKLAAKNLRRSYSDYAIYFLTLTFAVCIFYSFNSIESQRVMGILKHSNIAKSFSKAISIMSIFVSIILGSLIVYSNNFLIKKRKKELGIYTILGMRKSKISRILILETFLVGLISLVSGIIVGILFAQGLSIFTANLFGTSFDKYQFTVSFSAIGKTCLYFGIIFIIVMIFNQFTISKYKLIDLLYAEKKSEDLKLKSPFISLVLFIAAISLIGYSYNMVLEIGLHPLEPKFLMSIIIGVSGTFFFFFSLAGFFTFGFQKSKRIYLKDLNIFVMNQINSKINTNFISITVICLMLFMTIFLTTTTFSIKTSNDNMQKQHSSFDASGIVYNNSFPDDKNKKKIVDVRETLKLLNFKFADNESHEFFNEYKLNKKIKNIFNGYMNTDLKKSIKKSFHEDESILGIKISDYNTMRKLIGKTQINLEDNQVLIVSNYDGIDETVKRFNKGKSNELKLNGNNYKLKNDNVLHNDVITTGILNNFFYLIVPDDLTKGLPLFQSGVNIDFKGNSYDIESSKKKYKKFFEDCDKMDMDKYGDFFGYTFELAYETNIGYYSLILFLGIYLGIIFLMASSAVLALQQLSEASESFERYKILKKIGATRKMINKTIFIQIFTYFMLPFSLALVHSAVAIKVTGTNTYQRLGVEIHKSVVAAVVFLILVYGGYFYATYTGYKRTIKNI